MALDVSISDIPGLDHSSYIKVRGEFDAKAADKFEQFWEKQLGAEAKRFFILDLSGISLCGQIAARSLRAFNDECAHLKGGMAVVSPSSAVVAAMKATGVGHGFNFFIEYTKAFAHLRAIHQAFAKAAKEAAREATSRKSAQAPEMGGESSDSLTLSGTAAPPSVHPAKLPDTRAYTAEDVAANVPGLAAGPDGGPGAFAFRSFTPDGVTLQSAAPTIGTPAGAAPVAGKWTKPMVLIVTPPEPTFIRIRNLLADTATKAGYDSENLFPLRKNQGWAYIVGMVSAARAVLAVFSPKTPSSPDPHPDVLMAATLARAIHGETKLVLVSTRPKFPDLWQGVPREIYSDEGKRVEELIPRISGRLAQIVVPR